jgi:hypothetical protein
MPMKNSNSTNGNRTHDLPACGAVPQRAAPPRARHIRYKKIKCILTTIKGYFMFGERTVSLTHLLNMNHVGNEAKDGPSKYL